LLAWRLFLGGEIQGAGAQSPGKQMTMAEMVVCYVFGNGNLSFDEFLKYYVPPMHRLLQDSNAHFVLCDFRGTDVLALEYLKAKTPNVSLLHVGERARYLPDSFKTQVGKWQIIGGYKNDSERDQAAIAMCSHFIAKDYNSDENRKSGTLKNIEHCLALGKLALIPAN
jgi:hypothetical protein